MDNSQTSKEIIVRIVPHLKDDGSFFEEFKWRFPKQFPAFRDVKFVFDDNQQADIVVVLNYLKSDRRIRARRGGVWRWDNEGGVEKYRPVGFDRIFSHSNQIDPGLRTIAAPVLDWWVGKTFDELEALAAPEKSRLISAIASSKAMKEGHQQRAIFVSQLEEEFPQIDFFGRGREFELQDKWDGLAPYKYSVAIENRSKPDYWTEKISDCFLSYTVPLYFGATNISEYFPRESFIWLPLENPELAKTIIRETIERDDWESRLPALIEARRRVLEQHSFVAQISFQVNQAREEILKSPFVSRRVHGRRLWPKGWRRGAGPRKNLSDLIRRFL